MVRMISRFFSSRIPFAHVGVFIAAGLFSSTLANSLSAAQPIDFSRDIEPLLSKRCWDCHGSGKLKGGLRLDHRQGLLLGGDSGAAIVEGKGVESRLIRRVSGAAGEEKRMPPKGDSLTSAEITLLQTWIDSARSFRIAKRLSQPAASIGHFNRFAAWFRRLSRMGHSFATPLTSSSWVGLSRKD